MRQLRTTYPIALLCRVLAVSKSGYHALIKNCPLSPEQPNPVH